ncbi:hypothetical protein [Fodinibius sediminis]|uniref:Uncharacterized protein n=1 Tax=Fodinibius sediminis TaxID=1214077 RepID=A0A521AQY6_9BACT|nr:hypothetical protein [Fodinibius sediminis]SMO37234.1 hypothetical protein SAMN06265218_101295 [Fodinibius sediminis]
MENLNSLFQGESLELLSEKEKKSIEGGNRLSEWAAAAGCFLGELLASATDPPPTNYVNSNIHGPNGTKYM